MCLLKLFFADLAISAEGHAYMPLDRLVAEANYEPGIDHLIQTLEQTIDAKRRAPASGYHRKLC